MSNDPTVWGVHMGHHVSDRAIESGYVAIGWPVMGGITKLSPNRDAFKNALALVYRPGPTSFRAPGHQPSPKTLDILASFGDLAVKQHGT